MNSFDVLLPPRAEQTKIASFLDRETAKIDGLVGEQRRLIELLKEKRQAVISHAVTKGLNPHAPLKPSGIEWLGDVPEHWEVSTEDVEDRAVSSRCDDGPAREWQLRLKVGAWRSASIEAIDRRMRIDVAPTDGNTQIRLDDRSCSESLGNS